MRTRAQRRHFATLKKQKAVRMVRDCWCEPSDIVRENMRNNADNLKMCGGPCCCNPRHSGWTNGKTAAELDTSWRCEA